MTKTAARLAFGEELRRLRTSRGWPSQKLFARHVGMDRTYISGLECGRRNPTLEIIVLLASGLNVHPSTLLKTQPSGATKPLA